MKQEPLSLSLVKLIFVATIITSIGMILLIGATGYFLTKPKIEPVVSSPVVVPTPTAIDETANWRTYTNPNMRFSLEYPSDWIFFDETILSTGTEVNFVKGSVTQLSVWSGRRYSQELQRDYILQEWVTKVKNNIKSYATDTKEKNINLSGVPAMQLSYKNTKGDFVYEIYVGEEKNEAWYEISYSINNLEKDINSPIFDRIIASIKFMDIAEKNKVLQEIKLGDMEIENIEKVNPAENLSTGNVRITFTGKIVVTGTYHYYSNGEPFAGGMVCFDNLDNKAQAKIPQLHITEGYNSSPNFCFSNQELARKSFGPIGGSGVATIEINNYVILSYPVEGSNSAELMRVINKR